ncbi:DNA repair protein rad52 [Actinomortierella ambigua]|nr:DNA repair protein rad52 [Actinomortierella ambigua]
MQLFKTLATLGAVLVATVLARHHGGSTDTKPEPDSECQICAVQVGQTIPSCAALPSFPPTDAGTLEDLTCLCDMLSNAKLFAPCQTSCGFMADFVETMRQQFGSACMESIPSTASGESASSGDDPSGSEEPTPESGDTSGSEEPTPESGDTSGSEEPTPGSGDTSGSEEPTSDSGEAAATSTDTESEAGTSTSDPTEPTTTESQSTVTITGGATNTPTPAIPGANDAQVNTPSTVMLATTVLLLVASLILMIKQEFDAAREARQRAFYNQPANPDDPSEDAAHPHSTNARQMRHAVLQELLQPPKTEFTSDEKTYLDENLPKYLSPEYTSTRPGPGRTTLTYVEAWRIKNVANRLFGFNGWSSTVSDITTDFTDIAPDGRIFIGVSAVVRVTLKDGTCHEDIGFGSSENLKSKAASFEKAKKEAVTDALKRALTSFGNVLGSCLYDRFYCKEISQFKPLKRTIHESEYFGDSSPCIPRTGANPVSRPGPSGSTTSSAAGPSTRTPATPSTTVSATSTTAPRVGPNMRPTPLTSSTLNPPANNGSAKLPIQQPPTETIPFVPNNIAHSSSHQPPQTTTATTAPVSLPASAPVDFQQQQQQHHHHQNRSRDAEKEFEADDFLPADPIEEDRIFHPESPRMSDLDIDIDMLMHDESPVQVKHEVLSPWASSSTGNRHRPQHGGLPLRASSASPKELPSVARQLLNNFRYTKEGNKGTSTTTSSSSAIKPIASTPSKLTHGQHSNNTTNGSTTTPTRRPFGRVSSSPSLSSPSQRKEATTAITASPPQKPQLLQFQPIRHDTAAAAGVASALKAAMNEASTTASSSTSSTATAGKEPGLSFQPQRPKIVNPFVTGQPVPPRMGTVEGATAGGSASTGTDSSTVTGSKTSAMAVSSTSTTGVSLRSFSATAGGPSGGSGNIARVEGGHGSMFKSAPSTASVTASSLSSSTASSSAGSSQGSLSNAPNSSRLGNKRPFGAEGSNVPVAAKEQRLH